MVFKDVQEVMTSSNIFLLFAGASIFLMICHRFVHSLKARCTNNERREETQRESSCVKEEENTAENEQEYEPPSYTTIYKG